MSFLQLAGLTKTFDATTVLRGVDLSLDEGGFLAVLGPSGCGKSTLLRILAGLEAQDTGTVRIGGEAVDGLPPMARDIAMVFQSYALYPHMTVAENLALPLVMRRLTRRERLPLMRRLDRRVAEKRGEIRGEIERMAEVVALGGLLERKPKALSGGQRQRVALARALVRRPRLFLLDEPLSNLDASLRAATRTEIVELQRRVGVTTVYVTHDQTEAMTMADRIAVMLEGRLEQIGSARDIYRRPATLAVARFIGSPMISVLPGQVRSGRLELTNGTAIGQLAIADQKVEIGLRAEDIAVGPAPAAPLSGIVRHIEFLGSEALVHLRLAGPDPAPTVVARAGATEADEISEGSGVGVWPRWTDAHVFAADGVRLSEPTIAAPNIEQVNA
ncbi:MAG: ABC transporter ATP-binding protein [Pseudomonadota bacterium]